jgi:hypothetical protein
VVEQRERVRRVAAAAPPAADAGNCRLGRAALALDPAAMVFEGILKAIFIKKSVNTQPM